MKFEQPISTYSKERKDDLTLELEELQKKIDNVNSSLRSTSDQPGGIIGKQAELERYEKQKATLVARKIENNIAVQDGRDDSPKPFEYQPVDRTKPVAEENKTPEINPASPDPVVKIEDVDTKKSTPEPATKIEDVDTKKPTPEPATKTEDVDTKKPSSEPTPTPTPTSEKKSDRYDPKKESSWTKEENDAFDKEWAEAAAAKGAKSPEKSNTIIERGVVDDPEAAAMGGFDRGTSDKTSETVGEPGEKDPKNMGRDVKQEMEDRAKAEKAESDEKNREKARAAFEKNASMEAMRTDLDNKRRLYVSKHYQNEGVMSRLKALFGHFSTAADNDLAIFKKDYQDAYQTYRKERMKDLDALSPEDQQILMGEIREMDVREGVALYDERVNAKAETLGGRVGDTMHKVIMAYKGWPKSVKYTLAGAMLIGGLATGGAGIAGGAFAAAAAAKRALGAGVVGVGVTAAFEAKAENKEREKTHLEIEGFRALSIEEQKAALNGFNNKTLQDMEQQFHGKIAGRSRRVMYGLAGFAGMMAAGQAASHLFGGTEVQDSGAEAHAPAEDFNTEGLLRPDTVDSSAAVVEKVGSGAAVASSNLEQVPYFGDVAQGAASSAEQVPYFGDVPDAAQGETVVSGASNLEQVPYFGDVAQGAASSAEQVPYFGDVPDALESVETTVGENAGVVNVEALQNAAKNAFGENKFELDNIAENVSTEDSAQLQETVAEAVVGENVGSQLFEGVNMDVAGHGALIVEKGSSIEGTMIKFFEANSAKLTEGGMGWNPAKFKDVHEWAGKRAHGIVQEYMATHPGIDVDLVQPGTEIDLDLNNLRDVQMDVKYEGGPHIVPENSKIEFPQASTVAEQVAPQTAPLEQMAHLSNAEMAQRFGMSEAAFDATKGMPVEEYIREIQGHTQPDALEQYMMNMANEKGSELSGKTIEQVLEENAQQAEKLPLADVMREVMSNREWATSVGGTMRDVFGVERLSELGPIGKEKMSYYLGDTYGNPDAKGFLQDFTNRAQDQFGAQADFTENTSTQAYFSRIGALAAQNGQTQEFFPHTSDKLAGELTQKFAAAV